MKKLQPKYRSNIC